MESLYGETQISGKLKVRTASASPETILGATSFPMHFALPSSQFKMLIGA